MTTEYHKPKWVKVVPGRKSWGTHAVLPMSPIWIWDVGDWAITGRRYYIKRLGTRKRDWHYSLTYVNRLLCRKKDCGIYTKLKSAKTVADLWENG